MPRAEFTSMQLAVFTVAAGSAMALPSIIVLQYSLKAATLLPNPSTPVISSRVLPAAPASIIPSK